MIEDHLFFKRLKNLSKIHGKSLNQIERDLGYPRNALNNYKTNCSPSGVRLIQLSEYFGVTPHYLIGGTEDITKNYVEDLFLSLNREQKLDILSLTQDWKYNEKKFKSTK